jgi:hypothetical protein
MVAAEARARPMVVELKARTPVRFVDDLGKVRLDAWKAAARIFHRSLASHHTRFPSSLFRYQTDKNRKVLVEPRPDVKFSLLPPSGAKHNCGRLLHP